LLQKELVVMYWLEMSCQTFTPEK